MKIFFVRHGHPNYQLDCLTEEGHKQAALAAERLKDEGITEIYSSTCGRAVETAQHTADVLGLTIKQSFDFIREINWGNDDIELAHKGHPWETTDDMVPAAESLVNPDWAQTGRWKDNARLHSTVNGIAKGIDEWLLSLGYKREGEYYRVVGTDTNKTVAMFSHGGASAATFAHLFNLPFPFTAMTFRIFYTGITVVTLPDTVGELVCPQIDLLNDCRHVTRTDVIFGR